MVKRWLNTLDLEIYLGFLEVQMEVYRYSLSFRNIPEQNYSWRKMTTIYWYLISYHAGNFRFLHLVNLDTTHCYVYSVYHAVTLHRRLVRKWSRIYVTKNIFNINTSIFEGPLSKLCWRYNHDTCFSKVPQMK